MNYEETREKSRACREVSVDREVSVVLLHTQNYRFKQFCRTLTSKMKALTESYGKFDNGYPN
jgi:hypothetical protein